MFVCLFVRLFPPGNGDQTSEMGVQHGCGPAAEREGEDGKHQVSPDGAADAGWTGEGRGGRESITYHHLSRHLIYNLMLNNVHHQLLFFFEVMNFLNKHKTHEPENWNNFKQNFINIHSSSKNLLSLLRLCIPA